MIVLRVLRAAVELVALTAFLCLLLMAALIIL
jgi:hypothetical protein